MLFLYLVFVQQFNVQILTWLLFGPFQFRGIEHSWTSLIKPLMSIEMHLLPQVRHLLVMFKLEQELPFGMGVS